LLGGGPENLPGEIAKDAFHLVNGCFTAILSSKAEQIAMFFPDLFGIEQRYNEPGLVSDKNWTLRIPGDFEAFYESQLKSGKALDVERCLLRAAKGRGG